MTGPDPSQWVKARKSDNADACVEMRRPAGRVEVRDSKQRGEGATLSLHPRAFWNWVLGAKRGELDALRH